MNASALVAGALACAVAGGASATTYVFDSTSVAQNPSAGFIERITTTYTPSNNAFTWSVTFADQLTTGYTLAVSPGPNPKNNPGQLALIYFDASDTSDVAVSAYGYNGLNALNSFVDGNGAVAGVQAPDFIVGTEDAAPDSWLIDASVTDAGGKRTLSLTIDADVIQSHVPLYPDPAGDPWTGVAFGEKIGYWFHTFRGLNAGYDANGRLTNWGFSAHGWSDVANLNAITVVPLPPAAWAGLVGLAGAAVLRRRVG